MKLQHKDDIMVAIIFTLFFVAVINIIVSVFTKNIVMFYVAASFIGLAAVINFKRPSKKDIYYGEQQEEARRKGS